MLKLALNGGVLSSIWDAIKSIVSFFANFTDILKGIFQATIIYAYSIFYYLFMGICSMVNFAEMLFKKFAGIDPIMTTDGQMNILDVFVKSNEIWGLFVSILILSIVLLFIFTIVAVIKSEFSLDAKGSAKGPIIARSLKSLAMFVIVPVVSLLGVYAVNAITDTINSMMKGSDNTSMVNQIFYTMSYNANKARLNEDFAEFIDGYSADNDGPWANDNGGAFKGSQEDVAYAIDMAFKGNLECKYKYKWISFPLDMIECQDFSTLFMPVIGSRSTYSIWDITQVNLYYSVMDMDYIIGLGSAIVITYMLLSMCVVLIKRIFEIVILLLLAAPMISLAPLDGGSASKSWQKEFIKRVISIVAPVFAINMYFIMIPLFMKISIFGGGLNGLASLGAINLSTVGFGVGTAVAIYATYDAIFQLLAICVGMSVVKTASALLCNLLGIEDLVKSGQEATKKAVGTAVQMAGTAVAIGSGVGSLAAGGIKAIAGAKKAGKGNRLAGLKSGWAETQEQRGNAMNLLKDKTLKSDMVKGSAFGQLLDPDTYKNMGKTGKQIKEEKDKKEAIAKKKADVAADKQIKHDDEQKGLKQDYMLQTGMYYNEQIAKIDETLGKGGQYSKENVSAKKKEMEKAQKDFDNRYGHMDETQLAAARNTHEYEELYSKKVKAENAYDDIQKGRTSQIKERGRIIQDRENAFAYGGRKDVEFEQTDFGVQASKKGQTRADIKKKQEKQDVADIMRTERPEGTTDHHEPHTKIGKLAATIGNFVGDKAQAVGGFVKDAAGNVADKVAESGPVKGVRRAVGTEGISEDAAKRPIEEPASKKALLDQLAATQAVAEDKKLTDGMGEEVEKGLKEAAGDLAKAIKEALSTGKLPIDGMAKLTGQMEQFTKQFANAQKNNDTGDDMIKAINDLKDALANMLKK